MTASNGSAGSSSAVQAPCTPERAGEVQRSPGQAQRRAPRRRGPAANCAASRPIVPGPSTSTRLPAPAPPPGRPAARCRPARPGRRPTASTVSGSACSAEAGTGSCSASAPGQPPRMPISKRSAHTCCRPSRQRRQLPAAEHRVAGDAPAEPGRVDAVADRGRRCRTTRARAASGTRRGPGAGRPSRR